MEKEAKRLLIISEIITGVFGWCWFATLGGSVFFFVKAIFFKGSWWYFIECIIGAFIFYNLTLAYKFQKERVMRDLVHSKMAKEETV